MSGANLAGLIDRALPWGVVALAFFLPFSISGSQLVLGLMIVAVVARAVIRRELGFVVGPVGWLIVALVAWVVVAAPLSAHPGTAALRLPKFWIWATFFVCLAGLSERRTAILALRALVVSAGIVAIYGIAQHLWGEAVLVDFLPPKRLPTTNTGAVHAVGLFDHHLTYGNSLALTLLLGLGLLSAERAWRTRLWLAVPLGLALLGLLWSFARSAWLGLLAGLLAFGALKGKRVLAIAILAAFGIGAAAYNLSPGLADRMARMVQSDKNLERIYIWKTTGAMIGDHPVFGIGPGAYRGLTEKYRAGYNIHWTATSHAHNSPLQFAVESGVFAAVLFGLLLIVLISLGAVRHSELKEGGTRRDLLAGATAACACFAAASLLQHNAGDAEVCMLFQLAAALVVALARDEAPTLTRETT
jgi:O-antigen ligase